MKKEDFPILVFNGRPYRRVPELPRQDCDVCRCAGCAAYEDKLDRHLCSNLSQAGRAKLLACDDYTTDDPDEDYAHIYVADDRFTEYIVELVRRRISS